MGNLIEQLEILFNFSCKIGYKSIYLLIDKVDENYLTGNRVSNTYKFIEPLISNLQILELKGYGFKFFLWDSIIEIYQKDARPDRIKYYTLQWKPEQLKNMLSRRLEAFSQGKVKTFSQICDKNINYNIDDIIILLCQRSPRNIVRICKEIIDQQSEINSETNELCKEAIIRGIEVFAENYTNEILPPRTISDLKKIKRVSFTAKYIYNNVFKISQQAGSSKVKIWQDNGIIETLCSVQEDKKSRAVNLYGLKNILFAKNIFPELSIFEFYDKKIRCCPQCGQILLRDWDMCNNSLCDNCGINV